MVKPKECINLKIVKKKLIEAAPVFKFDREKTLKKKLIALLRDDGRGHHHNLYADRLEYFDIQIVPLSVDPTFTAAISYDKAIIYVSEGFITDPGTFFQLNVLLRHELAHNLLMHQVRMMYKLGNETFEHQSLSEIISSLHNIIADDEISNKKYTDEDKTIVRNMMLNGHLISGLVTEDHRASWLNMSLEEMYDAITEEIEEVQNEILSGRSIESINSDKPDDFIHKNITGAFIYTDTKSSSIIPGSLEAFIKRGCTISGRAWKNNYKEIAEKLFEKMKIGDIDDDKVAKLLKSIATSSPVKPLDLFDNKEVVLYTPEEKYIAVEVLKKYKSDYTKWLDRVVSSLDELSTSEIRELIKMLKEGEDD